MAGRIKKEDDHIKHLEWQMKRDFRIGKKRDREGWKRGSQIEVENQRRMMLAGGVVSGTEKEEVKRRLGRNTLLGMSVLVVRLIKDCALATL